MRSTRFQGQNPLMDYSPDEQRWIERKAREIVRETGRSLPVARAEAMIEFRRLKDRPKARVIPFGRGRLF